MKLIRDKWFLCRTFWDERIDEKLKINVSTGCESGCEREWAREIERREIKKINELLSLITLLFPSISNRKLFTFPTHCHSTRAIYMRIELPKSSCRGLFPSREEGVKRNLQNRHFQWASLLKQSVLSQSRTIKWLLINGWVQGAKLCWIFDLLH